jgi:DNA-binding NtrC family response regulator
MAHADSETTTELRWGGHEALASLWLSVEGRGLVRVAPGQSPLLGTSKDCDLRVTDATVSARHCRVTYREAGVLVEDEGSRNGVWVGGARVTRALILAGGSFEIGRTVVRVEATSKSSEEPMLDQTPLLRGVIGRSRPMRELAASCRKVAPLRLPVLLRGDSGTGKDLVARAIHEESHRSHGPFVVLNAATIARELAESELFGHERGAFTGAIRDRRGAFREAHHGTLFLDEIAALPLDLQAKLLRVVEEGMVRPVGGEDASLVDVRLVVATCEPLEEMVDDRRFRADLYERLAVCVVTVPPLRERTEDIAALARHLLATSELGDRELSPGALAALRAHRWPGNVRELRNIVVQAAILADAVISADNVAQVLARRAHANKRRFDPGEALRIVEAEGGNVSAAARRADVPRSTLRGLLRAARTSP